LESESVYKLKTLTDNQHLLELFDSMVIKNKVISEDEFWQNIDSYKTKSLSFVI